MKKILALVLALMMVMGLATTAFATNVTINGSGATARNYEAYQVMTATNDGEAYHYTVVEEYRAALVSALGITGETTDDKILEAIRALPNAEAVRHFADDLYREILANPALTPDKTWDTTTVTVDQGYWLIADVTDLSGKNESNSLVMLDTAGDSDVTINAKPDHTDSNKQIDDENDSILAPIPGNEDEINWQDVSDYDIGDKIPYRISGQVANNVSEYSYYSFKIVDTVSDGLTHNADSIELYVNGVKQTIKAAGVADSAPKEQWVYEITGNTMTIYPNYGYTKNDGTAVEASAANGGDFLKLFPAGTEHGVINDSTYTLRYTCTLNEHAVIGGSGNKNESKVYVSNNPYGDGIGETPLETTVTFTYKFVVDKVDPKGNPLTGAEFTLSKFIAAYTAVPAGKTEADLEADGYVYHNGANAWGKFENVGAAVITEGDTRFTFNGIDDGYYKLEETKVPDGYKKMEDLYFQITASHTVTEITELRAVVRGGSSQTLDTTAATGTVHAVIENHTGIELPSTGGMGTTVFYILGSIMVLGAVVLLVTKKRMSV